TLAAVAAIGPSELESQLGRDGRHAVLLARGDEPDQLEPWKPPMFTSAHRQFGEAVADRAALLFVARALCADLADELGLRGAGARAGCGPAAMETAKRSRRRWRGCRNASATK